jgi:hypothetical protein
MEKEDIISVQWAQEDVETSYNLLNNNEGMMLVMEKLWTYLYVYVSDVLVCRMSGCELSLIACCSCASSYNGFGSLTCCSVMSRFCWRYI